MAGDFVYEPEHRSRAKELEIPLFKCEIDARHLEAAEIGGMKYRIWGTISIDKAQRIFKIISEKNAGIDG